MGIVKKKLYIFSFNNLADLVRIQVSSPGGADKHLNKAFSHQGVLCTVHAHTLILETVENLNNKIKNKTLTHLQERQIEVVWDQSSYDFLALRLAFLNL